MRAENQSITSGEAGDLQFRPAAKRTRIFRGERERNALALPALAGGLLLLLVPVFSARAATFVVTTTLDGNNGACTVSLCTLRDAVIAANASPGSSISLPSAGSHYTLTLTGVNEDNAATGDLDIRANTTINGGGAATTVIDGNGTDRVFQVLGTHTLTLNDVTVTNGNTTTSSTKSGGGILASSADFVVLNNSVVTANNASSGQGGGIFAGTVTLTNSTVSQNQTSNQGGGIFALNASINGSTIANNTSSGDQGGGLFLMNGSSTIIASTISGNTSGDDGGGIYSNGSINVNSPLLLTISNSTISNNTNSLGNGSAMFILSFATVTITSSTISGNNSGNPLAAGIDNAGASVSLKNTIVASNASGNCAGTAITDGGTNLQFPGTTCGATITSADPLLQPLANNGGPTQTRLLGAGSPAINAAAGCPPPATDQRGISRPQGSACEIGSIECQTGECGLGAVTNTPTSTPTNTPVGVATSTPTNTPTLTPTSTRTPTTVAATATQTPTVIAGVVVPTLTFPMLGLLGLVLAVAGTALLLLKRG
jgi:CSLREA domain-containing protein